MFPNGVTHITNELAFEKRMVGSRISTHTCLFVHDENGIATFRMITSQFCVSGYAKQSDITRAFGVSPINVKRSVKLYRPAQVDRSATLLCTGGKLIGLDRAPEVRTLQTKLKHLAEQEQAFIWSAEIAVSPPDCVTYSTESL
jgi:hypothetical protein